VNGSHDGLVELVIDPPCRLPRQLSTVFRKMEVRQRRSRRAAFAAPLRARHELSKKTIASSTARVVREPDRTLMLMVPV
jgi:hypothetical protein